MRRKKSKKFLVRRMVAILVLLILLLMGRNLICHFWDKNQQKQTRLLYNNEWVQLTNAAKIENEMVYLSEEDVKKIFDDTIYYNVGDKELITTHNKHVAVLHLNQSQMMVNDSNLAMQGTLKEIEGKIYLPMNDLGIVYDVETEYAQSTNRVMMDSTLKAKSRAMILKNTSVKTGKGLLARTIQKVGMGDFVDVFENVGRYLKVRTKEGNIGYIPAKKVSNVETLREDWIEEKVSEKDVANEENLYIIRQENTGIANCSMGLATYSQRNEVINKIYADVIQSGKYMVCIDFEEIDDINCFYRFVIELTPKFREAGMKVGVKLNSPIDEKKIKNVVDFMKK